MINFNLFSIPITILPWFWITMAFIGGALDEGAWENPLKVPLFILAGFVSILIHELGHALQIRKYKQPTQIVLQAFGGYATYPQGVLNRKQSFLISLAGPAIQIILGVAVFVFIHKVDLPDTQIMNFLNPLWIVSLFWAILNLIPVYPLDGGQMLNAILGPRREHITFLVGTVLPIVFILVYFSLGAGGFLFPIFMALFGYQNWERYQATKPN